MEEFCKFQINLQGAVRSSGAEIYFHLNLSWISHALIFGLQINPNDQD